MKIIMTTLLFAFVPFNAFGTPEFFDCFATYRVGNESGASDSKDFVNKRGETTEIEFNEVILKVVSGAGNYMILEVKKDDVRSYSYHKFDLRASQDLVIGDDRWTLMCDPRDAR